MLIFEADIEVCLGLVIYFNSSIYFIFDLFSDHKPFDVIAITLRSFHRPWVIVNVVSSIIGPD